MTKTELMRLEAYLRKMFHNDALEVRPQPKKKDMAEIFIGGEFIAPIYRDDEDGEVSYQVQMAILEMDLAEV